jgi:hypothetical protein
MIHSNPLQFTLSVSLSLLLLMPLKTTAQTCEECHIVIDWTWSFDNDDLDDEL